MKVDGPVRGGVGGSGVKGERKDEEKRYHGMREGGSGVKQRHEREREEKLRE